MKVEGEEGRGRMGGEKYFVLRFLQIEMICCVGFEIWERDLDFFYHQS